MKIVKVEWKDAFSDDMSWTNKYQLDEFAKDEYEVPITHIGFLVKKTKKYITLVMAHCKSNGTYSGIFKIPTKWITSYKVLGEE